MTKINFIFFFIGFNVATRKVKITCMTHNLFFTSGATLYYYLCRDL
jgi:hypothetical protein